MSKQELNQVLGHADEADGIEEYDNPLPNWWLGLFYFTIVWAIVYGIHYHFVAHRSEVAALAAEKLAHHALDAGALGDGMAVAAMIGGDAVLGGEVQADAGGDALLADGDMQRPGHHALLVGVEGSGLEGADPAHGAVEIQQALDIVGRLHRRFPGSGLLFWFSRISAGRAPSRR